jgi:hypothetical protein
MAEQMRVKLTDGREVSVQPIFGDYAEFEELRGINLAGYQPGVNDSLFIFWIAAKRSGALGEDLEYPAFRSLVLEFDQDEGSVNPTPPAASVGDS